MRRRIVAIFLVAFACQSSTGNGQTLYNIRPIALAGPDWEYTDSAGNLRSDSYVKRFSQSGQAIGFTRRVGYGGPDVGYLGLGQDAWIFDGSTTRQIGLQGETYQRETPAGIFRTSSAEFLDGNGRATGFSVAFNHVLTYSSHAWYFDGQTTQRIGLYIPNAIEVVTLFDMAPTGAVIGQSYRVDESAYPTNRRNWYFDGTSTVPLGLTGTVYSSDPDDTHVRRMNDSGHVIGSTRRQMNNNYLGSDVWVFDGMTTTNIGLFGGVYEVPTNFGANRRASEVVAMNDSGAIIGHSTRGHTNYGQDAWIHCGSTTTPIGLFGDEYEFTFPVEPFVTVRYSKVQLLNEAGQAVGYSHPGGSPSTYVGSDAWFYDGTTTTRIGLTGPEYETLDQDHVVRRSRATHLTASGKVGGYSERSPRTNGENPSNADAWVYDGIDTQRVGLSGPDYERVVDGKIVQLSKILYMNDAGQAVGSTDRQTILVETDETGANVDTWFFNGDETIQLGLTGPGFEFMGDTGPIRYSYIDSLSQNGNVIGHSMQFDSTGDELGQAGWFYNGTTESLHRITYEEQNLERDRYTRVMSMTESGTVLGNYVETLPNNEDDVTLAFAFLWTEQSGMVELSQFIDGDLGLAGWQELFTFSFLYDDLAPVPELSTGYPTQFFGEGAQNQYRWGPQAFIMTPSVPEPISMGLVTMAVGLLCRRRRS